MSADILAPLVSWLIEPLEPAVADAIQRLRRAPDVRHIAIMPDVHLANDVCVGTVFGTSKLLYPQAVGGDIGCGMLAIRFDGTTNLLKDPPTAGRILADCGRMIPTLRRARRNAITFPDDLAALHLSHSSLDAVRRDEGSLQLGTLGGGNHFIELQDDEDSNLWLMIHSGSRAMGQAIRGHHMARATAMGSNLKALDAETDAGRDYLNDVAWARKYAETNRRAMAIVVAEILESRLGVAANWESAITTDHNHVVQEDHGTLKLWVHRKGAMPAGAGEIGVLPGSMGTESFHVEGRGDPRSLCSSAHGAGRALSREAARRAIPETKLNQQMRGIWYDFRMSSHLREEAPSAYKDVRAVLRAQRDLVKVRRVLRPVLNYKGR